MKKLYIPQTRDQLYLKLQQYFRYADDFTRRDAFSSIEEAEHVLYEALKNVFSDEPEKLARLQVMADEAFVASRSGEIRLARRKFGEITDEVH